MRPNAGRQKELCCIALVNLLWKIGERKYAVFAIQGPTLNFEVPEEYEKDNVTERLHVFRCKTKTDLRCAVRRCFPRVTRNNNLTFSAMFENCFLDSER